MTYDQARELVDIITDIATKEIERGALDADHWEQRDYLATKLYELRDRAATLLAGPDETELHEMAQDAVQGAL